jgi:LysM repeat protein
MRVHLLFFILMICFCLPIYSQTNRQDSLLKSTENLEIESVLDSIYNSDSLNTVFPAYNLYKSLWNNTNIKYPNSDFTNKNDTIVFSLVSFGESAYCQPFKGRILSKFGPRHGRMHTGTDIKLNLGDSVLCAFDGRVRLAKRFSGYGNLVLVRHNNGLETIYAHLKSISVKVNDTIRAGGLIGHGGRTGRATTEHLHFETRIFGDPFDSNKYIDFDKFALRSNTLYYCNKKIFIDPENGKIDKFAVPENVLAQNDSIKMPKSISSTARASAVAMDNPIQHIISQGDNLWTISKKYNTTIKSICELNKIYTNQVLKIGTILYISR